MTFFLLDARGMGVIWSARSPSHMHRTLIAAAFTIVLAACAAQPGPSDGPSSAASSSASSETLRTLQTGHFGVRYPADWTAKSNVTMPEAGYEMLGTRLTYPAEADGTTLGDAAMHLAYGSACPSLEGIESTGTPGTVTIGGKQWTHYVRDGAGAGNRYQGDTYVHEETGACYLVSTLEHSCNLGPDCAEGHTEAFDKAALDALFGQVLSTFSFRP